MQVKPKKDVAPIEVLELLEKHKEDELTQEQILSLEFLKKNLKIKDKKTYEELRKELEALGKFKPHQISKIIEILPVWEESINAIFAKERVKLSEEDVKKIVEIAKSVKEDGIS